MTDSFLFKNDWKMFEEITSQGRRTSS